MSYMSSQGLITTPASTGNVTYATGFQPSVVIFWTTGDTVSGDNADHIVMIGWTDGTAADDRAIRFASRNNVATTAVASTADATHCVSIPNNVNTAVAVAAFSAWTSTGFTLNWSTATTSGIIVNFLALGGTDITGVKSGSITPNSGTGNQAITGVGFQPSMVMFLAQTGTTIGVGAAVSSTARFACTLSATTAATMTSTNLASRMQDATKCIEVLTTGGSTTVLSAADFVTLDAGGFTINWTTASATPTIFYLALAGGTYAVSTFTKGANTTDKTVTVNAGLTSGPSAYLMIGARGTGNTAQSTGAQLAIGGSDGTEANSITGETTNGVINSRARSFADPGGVNHAYHQRANPTSTTAAGADEVVYNHTSFTSSGFYLTYATNGTATAYIFPYITFGANVPSSSVIAPGIGPVDHMAEPALFDGAALR